MAERAVLPAWVEARLDRPDRTAPDPHDTAATHSFRSIPEAGGKMLKVVHRVVGNDVLVVTAHFDRGAKR